MSAKLALSNSFNYLKIYGRILNPKYTGQQTTPSPTALALANALRIVKNADVSVVYHGAGVLVVLTGAERESFATRHARRNECMNTADMLLDMS